MDIMNKIKGIAVVLGAVAIAACLAHCAIEFANILAPAIGEEAGIAVTILAGAGVVHLINKAFDKK